MTNTHLRTLLAAILVSLVTVACGEATDTTVPTGGSEAGGKGDFVGGEDRVTSTHITDEITLINLQFDYQLDVRGELGESLTNLFSEAEAATGLELRATYHEAEVLSCDGPHCLIMNIDEVVIGEPGDDEAVTMSGNGGGLYALHKMMVAADYGSYEHAEYGRFSCTTEEDGSLTICAIDAFEPIAITEDIQLQLRPEGWDVLELQGEAGAAVDALFDLAQAETETDVWLRNAYINDIQCFDGECVMWGDFDLQADTTQGASATLVSRDTTALQGPDGLYYLLKLMVIANQGDFDGASHGPFSCRYENDRTICDVTR